MKLVRARLAALSLALSPAILSLLPAASVAQQVRHREADQQGRIGQGITSGQITPGGANRLERREANIDASRRADLAAHGGHLTAAEHRRLNQRENRLSGRIYTDKHNAVADPGVVPR